MRQRENCGRLFAIALLELLTVYIVVYRFAANKVVQY